ncbi:MAG: MASE1 domain-containing protein [Beijerinckiaceae bacterium]|nr:MASE1 domain-containing protein [Beijerinckiaceae bacterium]
MLRYWSSEPQGGLHHAVRATIRFAAYVAIYITLEWLSDLRGPGGMPITAWSPGLGVLFAAMARGDAAAPFALFVGAFVSETWLNDVPLDWATTSLVAAFIACVYALVAWLARALGLDQRMERVQDVALLLSAALGGALLAGVFITIVLSGVGFLPSGQEARVTMPLLVGDMIGVAVITPLVLRATRPAARAQMFTPSFMAGVAASSAAAAALIWLMLLDPLQYSTDLFYVLFLPVVFVALRNGLDGVCVTLAVTQVTLVAGLDHFNFGSDAYAQYQTLMGVLTATGLLAGAVSSERDAASRDARAARRRLKDKESEAARADRFQSVTGLASALAHEINQPMTAARAFARTAQVLSEQDPPDLPRMRDFIARSVVQIDGAAEILKGMREFIRRGDMGYSIVPPADILSDALLLVRPLAAQNHVRLASEAESTRQIRCDRVQIQQVLVNLIKNAIDAISGAGRDDGAVAIAIRQIPENRIEFSVRDNGPGVDPEFVAKVFEPLATTKPSGLGLGLAISSDIVAAHGGRIWLESSKPGTTEFRFWLPVASTGAEAEVEDGERGQP